MHRDLVLFVRFSGPVARHCDWFYSADRCPDVKSMRASQRRTTQLVRPKYEVTWAEAIDSLPLSSPELSLSAVRLIDFLEPAAVLMFFFGQGDHQRLEVTRLFEVRRWRVKTCAEPTTSPPRTRSSHTAMREGGLARGRTTPAPASRAVASLAGRQYENECAN